MMKLYHKLEDVLEKKNYAFFKEGDYNVNIIAVRNLTKGNVQSNLFDDELHLIYKTKNILKLHTYKVTTDPGLETLKNPINKEGTAIIAPGQYRGAYQLGYHQGKYEALVQRKPIKIFRDNNRDSVLDFESIREGMYGINIHKAGIRSIYVNNWSAGCIVFAYSREFDQFLSICKSSAKIYGNSFTLTVLTTDDFKSLTA